MLKINNHTKAFSLIEIIVAMAIVVVLSGLGVSKFRDFNSTKKVDKDVDAFIVAIRSAQSLANSQNSSQCGSQERLRYASIQKIYGVPATVDYQVYLKCEGDYLAGTPVPSIIITMNPSIKGTLSSGLSFSGGSEAVATFLPGAIVTPGATAKINSASECTCVRVEPNGTINKTIKGACVLTPTPPSDGCITWEN